MSTPLTLRFLGIPTTAALLLAFSVSGCERREPPGASAEPSRARIVGSGEPFAAGPRPSPSAGGKAPVPGSLDDNLPFEPTGVRIASIAWRTWIYTDTGPQRTRYGYLRAGRVVDARGPAIVNEGCEGGWYRINPRGFVCLGLGATLDLEHPVALAESVRPVRGAGLPYVYALAGEQPPLLYFKLPSLKQMRESEGDNLTATALLFRERVRLLGLDGMIAAAAAPPEFLNDGKKLVKPYGTHQPLRFVAHAGHAAADSGFAIQSTFEWEKRLFGLTTELDLVALDRTKLVKPSDFHGVELLPGEGLPVGFSEPRYANKYELNARGEAAPAGTLGHREGVKLTGEARPGAFLAVRDGSFVAEPGLRIIKARDSFPSFATGDRKWIDISIKDQTLVAYIGQRPVYATLVSTGRGGLGDPEKVPATVRGTFMIYQKDVSSTMDGDEDEGDSINLRDVPFVQYFHKGFALHGTYWHDEFGKIRSHGCVNLSPIDSAWLFEWTDPLVPPEWHGVINKERGTVVYVHP
jgi:lipoprotein-anchoring transpeptidase ErfK/SrfK